MSAVIRWEDPPDARRSASDGSRWDPVAEALRKRPGEWAVIAEEKSPSQAGSIVQNVKNAFFPAFKPAHSFEAVSRTRDGVTRVYTRYVGEVAG